MMMGKRRKAGAPPLAVDLVGVSLSLLMMMITLVDRTDGVFKSCDYKPVTFRPQFEAQKYGKPTAFLSTTSVGISPYSLVDPFRQSTLYHDYLLVGPGRENTRDNLLSRDTDGFDETAVEIMGLVIYDGDLSHAWDNEPNLVQHNLAKEYNWALINATGMLPSLTVVNTTFERSFPFHTHNNDSITYHLRYPSNIFRTKTTVPPMDVLVEFPAKTRTLLSLHTVIDYQSFGLLRWRLSPADPVSFREINSKWEFVRPNVFTSTDCRLDGKEAEVTTDPTGSTIGPGQGNNAADYTEDITYKFLLCIYQKRFFRIENPCIKDMFLFYIIRGQMPVPGNMTSYTSVPRLFIIIPMVYDVLSYKGWLDLTDVYCSRPEDPEECGDPFGIVLTNDHLLIHTDKGLYVSNSLNVSNANVSLPYSMKPMLKFKPIDPCAQFSHFNCSEVAAPLLGRQTIRRQRLFYTPVCHVYQYPVYDDMVMLVIEHVSISADNSEEQDLVTILYASKPYDDWQMLIHERAHYTTREGADVPIKELIGIFFNHHRRHFDISLLLNDNGKERTVRFVLPVPTDQSDEHRGYPELNGLLGNGFLEFEFPEIFHLTDIEVNPEALDVFFLGNQLFIAEAGGALVYLSVPVVYNHKQEESYFGECSFNHPDRSYVCTEKSHAEIYVGRVGVSYAPVAVDYRKITEFKYTMLYNLWPFKYRQFITLMGHFTAGYSGKVIFWYLYDHNELVREQKVLEEKLQTNDDLCSDAYHEDDRAMKCHICKRMEERLEVGCTIEEISNDENDPIFRMLSFDPANLPARETTTHGPLMPFLIDGDKVLVMEAKVPSLKGYRPFHNYLHAINVGNKIICRAKQNNGDTSLSTKPVPPAKRACPEISVVESLPECELYIRHMKSMLDSSGNFAYLDGIHRFFYATIVKPFPMKPIPTAVVVVVQRNTNNATVQLDTDRFVDGKEFLFSYAHIGQTLYIPGEMSVLLTGFPEYKQCNQKRDAIHNKARMVGYVSRYYRQGRRAQVGPFKSFLINFSTVKYCQYYNQTLEQMSDDCSKKDRTAAEFAEWRENAETRRKEIHNTREQIVDAVNKLWQSTSTTGGGLFQPVATLAQTFQQLDDAHLRIRQNSGDDTIQNMGYGTQKISMEEAPENTPVSGFHCPNTPNDIVWRLVEGGCHLQLYLVLHPVLKQSGGRISLDKHDSISFTLKLRSLSPLGKSLIHRSLLTITNTNPDILTVEKKDFAGADPQKMQITLTPTGLSKGVATVTVRPLIVSTQCAFADGSFTLIVQVQREEGRRLHVNYPMPICKPTQKDTDDDHLERRWKVDLPSCVSWEEMRSKSLIRRPDEKYGTVFYQQLPTNYRPPSSRGSDIPLSTNVYNVDPSKHSYKNWYRVSNQTGDLGQCAGKETKEECSCFINDQFFDDVRYTDCKRMAYTANRNTKVGISVEYDRLMKDEDQHKEFFSPKTNWTVFLEEVNNRTEFTVSSIPTKYLDAVKENAQLKGGHKYYDSKTLGVTLHGTGLFHFQVSLGDFESFDKVSGFFLLYCAENELNHVQLVVVMLLTIAVCMVLVFCGFLVVRGRLASQLPYKTLERNKLKVE